MEQQPHHAAIHRLMGPPRGHNQMLYDRFIRHVAMEDPSANILYQAVSAGVAALLRPQSYELDDIFTTLLNPQYRQQSAASRRDLHQQSAAVILTSAFSSRLYSPSNDVTDCHEFLKCQNRTVIVTW